MWRVINGELTNTDFIPLPTYTMTGEYPSALWRCADGKVQVPLPFTPPEHTMTGEYPNTLWRLNPETNNIETGFLNEIQSDMDRDIFPFSFMNNQKTERMYFGEKPVLVSYYKHLRSRHKN